MAIQKIKIDFVLGANEYIGLTIDDKATIKDAGAGSQYLELDGAKRLFIYDGSTWIEL